MPPTAMYRKVAALMPESGRTSRPCTHTPDHVCPPSQHALRHILLAVCSPSDGTTGIAVAMLVLTASRAVTMRVRHNDMLMVLTRACPRVHSSTVQHLQLDCKNHVLKV
jgi:hypothetical protein